MKILLINLAKALERLAFQNAQFARLGLVFERVEGVGGEAVDDGYYKKMAASGLRLMSRNEVGCFLSHLKCWQKCVALNEPVLVLEDDAVVSEELESALSGLSLAGACLVNLEMASAKKRLGPTLYTVNDRQSVYELIYAGAGAGGYVITPDAAKVCVEKAKHQIGLADTFLYSVKGIKRFQLAPACVMQLCFFDPSAATHAAKQTSIHAHGSRRPGSLESFIANPMTRLRRLQSWLIARYQRSIKRSPNGHIVVTPSDTLYISLQQTRATLHG